MPCIPRGLEAGLTMPKNTAMPITGDIFKLSTYFILVLIVLIECASVLFYILYDLYNLYDVICLFSIQILLKSITQEEDANSR